MYKVLYISLLTSIEDSTVSSGVIKKIKMHIDALNKYGNDVDYTYTDGKNIFLKTKSGEIKISKFTKSGFKYYNSLLTACKKYIQRNKLQYDYIYIRHSAFSVSGFLALRYLSKVSNCIYLEIPTYFQPKRTLKNFIKYYFNGHIKKYVHKIVLDSVDETAFGIETLRIINGTDLERIKPKPVTNSDTINVLLVAYIQEYHGVDKIINAIKDYYFNHFGKRSVFFHIVGNGPRLEYFIERCKNDNLNNYIHFYGKLEGESLFDVFDKCEIGISSLSNKELGVTCSSTLKSKEYLAKGLPIISDTMLDVFYNNPKYFFHQLEKDFSLDELFSFYDFVYSTRDKSTIIREIREFAEQTCDMFKVFKAVNDDYAKYINDKKN